MKPHAPVQVGRLLFEDEFNSPEQWGTRWAPDWFGGARQNNVITDPANVTIGNGKARLALSANGVGALISTNPAGGATPGFTFGYGYAQVRALFQATNWPAAWTTGQQWPATGENDIAELLGGELTTNYHATNTSVGATPAGKWTGYYHVYGVHRLPGRNEIWWDSQMVYTYATTDDGAPHYLVANIGQNQGAPAIPGVLLIDHWRVWALP